MRNLFRVASTVWLLWLVASCNNRVEDIQKEQQAVAGAQQTSDSLPKSKEFEKITMVRVKMSPVYDTEIGQPCYYGRIYTIMGSALSEQEALELYTQELEGTGWLAEGRQYVTARGFSRGTNAYAAVYYGDPGVDIEAAADYTSLRRVYKSLIFVRVDYMIPRRQGC